MQCSGRCGDGGHVVCRDGGRIVDPCDGLDGWSYIELNVVFSYRDEWSSWWGVIVGGCHGDSGRRSKWWLSQ